MNRKQVYSVSSVNQYIKSLFMDDFALNHIYVRGEVSNCKYHSSGHIYFTLKDRGGAIACVMFAGNRKGLNFRMSEGMAVIVYGSVSVYERDGKYQLYAREIIQEGAGRLYEAYEALKKKLLAEGLCHFNSAPYYDYIYILRGTLQEYISYITSYNVTFQSQFVCRFGD